MATTWQGKLTSWLASNFDAAISGYEVKRLGGGFTYLAQKTSLPVDVLVGGRRHGIGFLAAIDQVDGIPLGRRTLIQSRYAWSPEQGKLLLAPGCSAAKPDTLEATLGLVLSPTFEKRCLDCHGQRDQGVRCESCHGPGSEHLAKPGQSILNPARLSNEDSIQVCAQCHVGLTNFADPSGDDLLVANQVRAIERSECFIQSGRAFNCVTCHNPHQDSTDDPRAVKVCLNCHAEQVKSHAAICPVNARAKCIECHMPAVEMGPLHLVDHWIRVHPEQGAAATAHSPEWRTQVRPLSAYVRMISASNKETALRARARVLAGEPFYSVARETSLDGSAAIGGYLGERPLALDYGQVSEVTEQAGRWKFFQRLPRDFRWQAEQLENQAEALAAKGDAVGAIGKAQEALKIYPRFLKALTLIATTYIQAGNAKKGTEVLAVALKLYPDDAATHFELGATHELQGDLKNAQAEFARAIELEKDFTAAYVHLGSLQFKTGDWHKALETFRNGLVIDPLSAEMNYGLAQALFKAGDVDDAKRAQALAERLDLGVRPN